MSGQNQFKQEAIIRRGEAANGMIFVGDPHEGLTPVDPGTLTTQSAVDAAFATACGKRERGSTSATALKNIEAIIAATHLKRDQADAGPSGDVPGPRCTTQWSGDR
jgi:hypothetical protein